MQGGPVTIDTTLGPGAFYLRSMLGRETLSQPFFFEVDLLSTNGSVKPADVVGQPMAVHLETVGYGLRHFTGLVTRFQYTGTNDTYAQYRATLRPWLWFLKRNVNSRVFQHKSIPDIAKQIFREHGFTDFSESLSETYTSLEYVIQYCESDFDFVSRLLERAGIYYFFKHAAGKHELVLADSYGAHQKVPGYETVPFRTSDAHRDYAMEYVEDLTLMHRVTSGVYSHADYDFTRPTLQLYTSQAAPKDHAGAGLEIYEYPGRFLENADGEAIGKIRLQELQAAFEVCHGATNARGIGAGHLVTVEQHPRPELNREYLLVVTEFELHGHAVASGTPEEFTYRCSFEARDSKVSFRPPRTTPKPSMLAPQTAVVVGKAGEDIWTDEHGRIKIQFHWDREGKLDENSSCFVRVAQFWAGDGWGAQFIPRIGQEVIVQFLEGDPDQPLVVGSLYNGQNKPPYDLPANQTQSGVKSRSSKDGTPDNFNEIRFEDKKGSELFYMQAEKDHTTLVKNNQSTTVKANRSASVTASDSVSVGGDRSVSVTGNLSTTVKGGGKSPVHHETTVTGKSALHASDTIEMDAPTHIKFTVGSTYVLIEPAKITLETEGKGKIVIDAHVLAQSSDESKVVLDANAFVASSGKSSVLLDANACVQSSGKSQMLLDSDASVTTSGTVSLKGAKIDGKGDSEVGFDGGGSTIALSPASADLAGAQVNVNAKAVCSIGGPMVKIG